MCVCVLEGAWDTKHCGFCAIDQEVILNITIHWLEIDGDWFENRLFTYVKYMLCIYVVETSIN